MQHLRKRLPELISLCRQSIGRWNEGDVFGATTTFQDHMSSQVSHLSIGVDCSQYIDELLSYQHRALVAHVQGGIPKFMLSTPKMKRAKKHIREMLEAIHSSHTPAQRKGKPPDLADAILELHRNDPQFLPETDLTFPFVASMVASIYLGSSLGFAVYAMVNNQDLYDRIRQEAESIFGDGRLPDAEELDIEKVDTTHRLFLEIRANVSCDSMATEDGHERLRCRGFRDTSQDAAVDLPYRAALLKGPVTRTR